MSTATVEPRHGLAGWARWAGLGQTYGPAAALALLVLVNALFTPHFATTATLWNVLLQVAPTILVAVGMTLVIATRGVDLSVGSVMAVASAVAAVTMDYGAITAALVGLAAAAMLGAVNGVLIARFHAEPFIVTLALLLTGRGLAQVVSNEGQVLPFANAGFEYFGKGYLGPVPVPVVVAVVVAAGGMFVTRATMFGRYLSAVGSNEAAARLAGVPVARTRLAAYLLSALLAGLAGLVETARLGATDPSNLGSGMEFGAIFAVVMGGTSLYGGRAAVGGSVLGALTLAVIGTGFNMLLIPYAWALLVQAAIILFAVYIQRPPAT